MRPASWVSTLLPKDAREALVAASRIDPMIDAGLSFTRSKAIDNTVLRIKAQYPHLFNKVA